MKLYLSNWSFTWIYRVWEEFSRWRVLQWIFIYVSLELRWKFWGFSPFNRSFCFFLVFDIGFDPRVMSVNHFCSRKFQKIMICTLLRCMSGRFAVLNSPDGCSQTSPASYVEGTYCATGCELWIEITLTKLNFSCVKLKFKIKLQLHFQLFAIL